jgi:hypothetical protein
MDTIEEPETAASERRTGRTPAGSARCCRNAIRDGCRSLTHFPEDMQRLIDAKEDDLHAAFPPRNELEGILLEEIAIASIQVRVCEGQVEIDQRRVRAEIDLTWDGARRSDINALAERLGKSPTRVAHQLEQSLQGAQHCRELWIGLGDSVEANGKLTEAQRQLAFDLLGVGLLSRDGTKRVPAADDAAGLLDLVQRQVQRLTNTIEGTLKHTDLSAKLRAGLGQPAPPDAETRRVRSNHSRAKKRLTWATEMFWRVRHGLALGQPIDPEDTAAIFETATGKAGARARAKAAAEAAASNGPAPAAAPAEPAAPPSDPPDPDGELAGFKDDGPIWVPENITGENREAMIMAGTLLRSMFRGNDLAKLMARPFAPPPTSSPPSPPPPGSEEPNAG